MKICTAFRVALGMDKFNNSPLFNCSTYDRHLCIVWYHHSICIAISIQSIGSYSESWICSHQFGSMTNFHETKMFSNKIFDCSAKLSVYQINHWNLILNDELPNIFQSIIHSTLPLSILRMLLRHSFIFEFWSIVSSGCKSLALVDDEVCLQFCHSSVSDWPEICIEWRAEKIVCFANKINIVEFLLLCYRHIVAIL